jgi:hypothetical protein
MAKNQERHTSIEKSVEAIFKKAEARERAGGDFFEVGWQSALEILLLTMEKHMLEQPGRLLPMQINDQDEWEFYLDVVEKLDLPPDTCAVFITPNAFKDMPFPTPPEFETSGLAPWERNAYSIVISGLRDHTVVMQASLPGIEYAGIDVFEDGKHFADYTYNTIEECLDDLTSVTWTFFKPKGAWTDEQITRYTENWFAKGIDTNLENAVLHNEYSYVHHPELLNLTPLEAIFKLIEATIPKDYDSLERAIEIANELNQDFDLGEPLITKEGILEDNEPQCRSLLGRIEVEADQHLDTLEEVKGVRFPFRSINDRDFKPVFDETARKVYEVITGRPYPESVNIS